jgi:hypothetical protein
MNEGEKTAVAADAGVLWRSGADIESLVKFMRERGFSQAQSTKALERVTGLDAIKAQIAVIYSETWRDQFQRNVQINRQFIDALIQLGQESGDSTITETELDVSFDPETILHSTIAA